jgi:HMGL-like
VLAITHEMVSHARSLIDDVEFSAEDALRSEPEFLAKVYSVAIAAGATTINVSAERPLLSRVALRSATSRVWCSLQPRPLRRSHRSRCWHCRAAYSFTLPT